MGLGLVNGRYFLFHAGRRLRRRHRGSGGEAGVAQALRQPSSLLFSAVETWFRRYDHSRPRFAVHVDGEAVDDVYFGVCLNTNPYTYLGTRPLNLAPEATLDTGLTMISVRSLDFVTIIGLAASALASGDHLRHSRQVDYRTDLAALSIEGYGPFPYQVDGDYLGEVTRLEFRHEPEALALVIP